ncbi:MAG: hypothetical protein CBC35_11830 [Planctomycetes bacterium TMED75]|nr:MAG: hypothetical protein CBC35_11830 [Planctomycetes bacterium TMED75]
MALAALGCCIPAHAELYEVTMEPYGAGKRQLVSANGSFAWDFSSGSEVFYNVRAVEHLWVEEGALDPIYTHCVEIYQSVVPGNEYSFQTTAIENIPERDSWPGPMGEQRAKLVEDLYANYVDPLTGGVYDTGLGSGVDLDDYAAAFQLMLWEITHENFAEGADAFEMATQISFDFGAIQSEADSSVFTVLDNMFLTLNDGFLDSANLEGWTNPDAQDQSRLVIPGAGTLTGLAFMIPMTRRRRRS